MTGSRVPIRPASTVMLLRDAAAGVEVFTLRRVAGMPFAGGMTAFPGGGVDPSDDVPAAAWRGPDASWWSAQWGVDERAARAQVQAVVRELFEETGVLLAGSEIRVSTGALESARDRLASHRAALADVLAEFELPLRADLLRPWARWITPAGPPRRYDTFFFLAALPDGQRAASLSTEASSGQWERPAEVLRAGERGDVGLMPPTVAMLTDLAAADSVAELLATRHAVEPVTPQVVSNDGEVLRVSVGGRDYVTRMTRPAPRETRRST